MEVYQTLFAQGAYTESDNAPARNSSLATQDYTQPPGSYAYDYAFCRI